jgi:hypothetical protein
VSKKIEVREFGINRAHYVKRSVAEILALRMLAEWIVRDQVIQMCAPPEGRLREWVAWSSRIRATNHFVPLSEFRMGSDEALPPVELPGIKYVGPRSPIPVAVP